MKIHFRGAARTKIGDGMSLILGRRNNGWEPTMLIDDEVGVSLELPLGFEVRPKFEAELHKEYITWLFNELHEMLDEENSEKFAQDIDAMHHDYQESKEQPEQFIPRAATMASRMLARNIDHSRLLIDTSADDVQNYVVVSPDGGLVLQFVTGGVNGKSAHDTARANVSDLSEQLDVELTLWSSNDKQVICRACNGAAGV